MNVINDYKYNAELAGDKIYTLINDRVSIVQFIIPRVCDFSDAISNRVESVVVFGKLTPIYFVKRNFPSRIAYLGSADLLTCINTI